MRQLIILLLFVSFYVQGQTLRDSLINNTWLNIYEQEINFTDSRFVYGYGGYGFVPLKYEVRDSTISYTHTKSSEWHTAKFKYHNDSLTIFTDNTSWPYDCWKRQNRLNKAHRVLYSRKYLEEKPDSFYKIQIKTSGGSLLEVDSAGNIFYNANGYGFFDDLDYYGHYRGKLKESKSRLLNQIIESENVSLKRLSCKHDGFGADSSPPKLIYYSSYGSFSTSHYLNNLRRQGFQTFDFLLESIDFKTLKFQKFADSDSVPGVALYKPTFEYWTLIKCRPSYLTSYEDEGDTFYLYSATADSVYYGPKTKTSHNSYDQFYFYADTLLNESASILMESHEVSTRWFYRGRAFEKPNNLVFLRLEWFVPFPEDYKMISLSNTFWGRPRISSNIRVLSRVSDNGLFSNPFPQYFRTEFGLPYPFLRPDFQVAFEEYVLPDWEEYLKQKKNK